MMDKLFKICCRLCLHDGSAHRLLDILSVKGLKENISNVFNVEIGEHDACTTNICLSCFNETFNLQKQFQLYEEKKRTILENQKRVQENSTEATSDPTPNNNTSASVAVGAADKTVANATVCSEKQMQSRKPSDLSRDASGKNLEEADKQQNKTKSHSVTEKAKNVKTSRKEDRKKIKNVPEESQKKVEKSVKETIAIVENSQQKKQSVTENAIESASADQVRKQIPVTTHNASSILKRRFETQAIDVSNINANKSATAHRSTDGNNPKPNNAQSATLSTSNTVGNTDEANVVNIVNIQRQEAQLLSDEPPSFVIQKVAPFQGSTITKEITTTASAALSTNSGMVWINTPVSQTTTVQSNYSNHATQNNVQSVVPAVTYTIPTVAVLPTVASSVNSSVSMSSSVTSSTNQVVRCVSTAMVPNHISQAQNNINHSSTITYSTSAAGVNQGSSLLTGTDTNATSAVNTSALPVNITPTVSVGQSSFLPSESQTNVCNSSSSTSPAGAPKKRRHSTYLRVSSNLFDEPQETAQFAMLNNNRMFRNFEDPARNPLSLGLPVLPPGLRVQTMMNPTTLPNNALNHAAINNNYQWQHNVQGQRYRPILPAGGNNTQTSTTSTSIATTAGTMGGGGAVNHSSIIRQQSDFRRISGSTLIQQGTVVPNNGSLNHMPVNSINTAGGIAHDRTVSIVNPQDRTGSSALIRGNGVGATNTTLTHSVVEQNIRPCFRCNICITYYLIEQNLASHLQRIHNVEKNEQTCSKVYDANILNKLLTRFRRKSIADPLTLTNNRAQLN